MAGMNKKAMGAASTGMSKANSAAKGKMMGAAAASAGSKGKTMSASKRNAKSY